MPFPVMNQSLARALSERGYHEPTPVQRAVLEPETAGRDLLVSAQTGSGKTVAFGAAIAPTLLGEAEAFGRPGKPLALIIAPTRELALQVERELAWLYGPAGGKIASCVGGMDIRREARALDAGCHIVVGTPGRLKDHVTRKRLDLSQLKAVVLDEADEMLDMGFKEDLEFILDATPPERRTLLFSATIPHDIATLAKRYQTGALRISTSRDKEAHADIEYRAIRVAGSEIERAVVNVLRYYDVAATLVFCSTREAVKRLHGSLIERGFAAVALSGELSQAERTSALQSLRDRRSRVCVATDVAARGLDLPDLGLVVHADLPNDRETLLHRSGRTGRAGRKGLCVLLVPPMKRRRAELLLKAANLSATWGAPPSADEVRAKDQERMANDPAFSEETTEEDLAVARSMLNARSSEDVAVALVRVLRGRLPAPEEVSDPGQGSFRDRRPGERSGPEGRGFEKRPYRQSNTRENGVENVHNDGREPVLERDREPVRERLKSEETVWFRINIGRNRNAEPRWLIPLICKAGGITKAEIGSIRIFESDTRFQIAKDNAEAFGAAVKDKTENNTLITPAFGPESRMSGAPGPSSETPRPHKSKPYKHKSHDKFGPAGGRPETGSGVAEAGHAGKSFIKDKKHFSRPAGEKSFEKPANGKPSASKSFAKPYKAKKKHKASGA